MRNSQDLTTFDTLVVNYLANRRAFGRKLRIPAIVTGRSG